MDEGKGIEELRRRLEAREAPGADGPGQEGGTGIEELRRRLEARKKGAQGAKPRRAGLRGPALACAAALVVALSAGAALLAGFPGGGPAPAGQPAQASDQGGAVGQEDAPAAQEDASGSQDVSAAQEDASGDRDASAGQDGGYRPHEATELFDALRDDAAQAEESYLGEAVELTGYLKNVDSGGRYFFVGADPDEWSYSLDCVRCDVPDGALFDRVLSMGTGDRVTVRGRVVGVGEVLGFVMEADGIGGADGWG